MGCRAASLGGKAEGAGACRDFVPAWWSGSWKRVARERARPERGGGGVARVARERQAIAAVTPTEPGDDSRAIRSTVRQRCESFANGRAIDHRWLDAGDHEREGLGPTGMYRGDLAGTHVRVCGPWQ